MPANSSTASMRSGLDPFSSNMDDGTQDNGLQKPKREDTQLVEDLVPSQLKHYSLIPQGHVYSREKDTYAEPNADVANLQNMLRSYSNGCLLASWRKVFDPYCFGDVTFTKFCQGLVKIGATGDAAVAFWKRLDIDGSNLLTLDEIDFDSFMIMEYCQRFCADNNGAVELFKQLDFDASGMITRKEFGISLQKLGFCDDESCPYHLRSAKLVSQNLFPVMDLNNDSAISLLEVLFLEQDIEKRRETRRDILRRRYEMKYGPKAEKPQARELLNVVSQQTTNMPDFISFMNNYFGNDSAFEDALDFQSTFVEPPWVKRLKKAVDADHRLNAPDKQWSSIMTSRMRIHAELEGKIRSHKQEAVNLGIKSSNKRAGHREPVGKHLTRHQKGRSEEDEKKEKIAARRVLKLVYHHAIVRALRMVSPSYIEEAAARRRKPKRNQSAKSLYHGSKEMARKVERMKSMPSRRQTPHMRSLQLSSISDLNRSTESLYAFYAQYH